MRIKTHLDSTLYLSSLWSDLSKWGHYFIVLNLRKPNLRSSLSQLSAAELVIAGAQMFFLAFRITLARVSEGRDHLNTPVLRKLFAKYFPGWVFAIHLVLLGQTEVRWEVEPSHPSHSPSKLLFPLEEMTSNNLERRTVVKITTFLLLRSIQHGYISRKKFNPQVKPYIVAEFRVLFFNVLDRPPAWQDK